jgi:hypothetical protein
MSIFKRWRKLESGQAMAEYWPTIPAAIAIIVSATMLANFIKQGLNQTTDVLYRAQEGVSVEICKTTEDDVSGPSVAQAGPHTIELVNVTYDPSSDQTTVTYEVTSGNPLIKSMSFDIPDAISNNEIKVASENWAPGNPPDSQASTETTTTTTTDTNVITTAYTPPDKVKVHGDNGLGNGADAQPPGNPPENDVVYMPATIASIQTFSSGDTYITSHTPGIDVEDMGNGKKHIEYEGLVYEGDGTTYVAPDDDESGNTLVVAPPKPGQPGNKQLGSKGKGKHTIVARAIPNLYLLQEVTTVTQGFSYGESRDISFVLQGQVTFQEINVTVWTSQTNSYTTTISGPVKVVDEGTTTTVISCDN